MRRQHRRAPGVIVAAMALAVMVGLGGQPMAAESGSASQARYRLIGHGTDHGVGLSQRGAAGRARAGQTYDQILLHYFDSRTTFLDTLDEDTALRALVVRSRTPSSTETALVKGGEIRVGGEDVERSRWTFDTPDVDGRTFPTSWRLVLIGPGRTGPWHLEVQDAGGRTRSTFTDDDARITVTPVAQGAGPAVTKLLLRSTRKRDTYKHTYAGTIRIGRAKGRIRVVNHVPIESFARSVVPEEMGPTNHPEALKSQAVAARSYFFAGRNRGTADRFLGYDLEADRGTHSYKGVYSEVPVVSEAVDATAFQVLRYVDGGSNRVVRAFYHAVGGGATEASMNVFTTAKGRPGTRVPYLMGGPDVDEQGDPYDERSPMYRWQTRALTLEQLSRILAKDPRTNVGKLRAWPVGTEGDFRARRAAALLADARDPTPAPENRGASGRLTWIVLKGTRNGKKVEKRVAGWVFKQVFNKHRGSGDPLGSTMIFRERVGD